MLITLMYHRAIKGKYGNDLGDLENHFIYIKKHFETIFPEEPCSFFEKKIVLTFDDATADFYLSIFPLLKKYQLKAIVAVPAGFISQNHFISNKDRLALLECFSFQNNPPTEAFCSYNELSEMQATGLVKIACHSFSHPDLTQHDVDLKKELYEAKILLEKKLSCTIQNFFLPYGKSNSRVLGEALRYYNKIFRIGGAYNLFSKNRLLTRISADNCKSLDNLFKFNKKFLFLIKSFKL